MTKVLKGEIRRSGAQNFVVMRRERGRAGEARTMIIVGRISEDGRQVYADSARSRSHVATWPVVGRVKLGPEQPPGHPMIVY